ncbi:hypothetical protein GCM10011365_12870 [Marinicella pacifica]|jgi:small-conductance mechanosensitive channel|uniref:Uncharacterized protein n=1 Tax=Marinicella pacifica TaxID=1171543 RepID=A0A917CMY5_9GAMM|nr:hypothetical protein [Marinicella pacifica]GGF93040.1 hypothetical protein GCM10011365_12870 [Marinicella pacifica]
MSETPVVFSPLRVVLMILITLSNLAVLIAFAVPGQPWSQWLRLFGIVFVMMFVFVILLEITWLHHRGKHVTDAGMVKQYRLAKIIYVLLLVSGIVLGLVALL